MIPESEKRDSNFMLTGDIMVKSLLKIKLIAVRIYKTSEGSKGLQEHKKAVRKKYEASTRMKTLNAGKEKENRVLSNIFKDQF